MGRYTGPKARINRRLGMMIYENGGAVRAMERRDNSPGMHTRGRRPSNYGLALMEKQKIKHYYGLGERQLRRYFDKAGPSEEKTLCVMSRQAGYSQWPALLQILNLLKLHLVIMCMIILLKILGVWAMAQHGEIMIMTMILIFTFLIGE